MPLEERSLGIDGQAGGGNRSFNRRQHREAMPRNTSPQEFNQRADAQSSRSDAADWDQDHDEVRERARRLLARSSLGFHRVGDYLARLREWLAGERWGENETKGLKVSFSNKTAEVVLHLVLRDQQKNYLIDKRRQADGIWHNQTEENRQDAHDPAARLREKRQKESDHTQHDREDGHDETEHRAAVQAEDGAEDSEDRRDAERRARGARWDEFGHRAPQPLQRLRCLRYASLRTGLHVPRL